MPEVIRTTCVSCQDSPLSTTASIIGILTFGYALLVGFWFYLKSGAKAIATSPEQFFTILESILKRLQETSVLGIGKIDCGPEQEELLLKTRRFRYQILVILLQLASWIGSGQLFGKYEDLVERGRMDPGFGLEASDIEDAFPIFQDILFRYMTKTKRYKPMYLSPHWIGWALRFRWNQSPLRRALDEYHKMEQEIEKIRQRQAAR